MGYEDADIFASQLSEQLNEATGRRQNIIGSLYENQNYEMNGGEVLSTALLSILPAVLGGVTNGSAGAAMGAEAGAAGAGLVLGNMVQQQGTRQKNLSQQAQFAGQDVNRLSNQLGTTQRSLALAKGRDAAMADRDYTREVNYRNRPRTTKQVEDPATKYGYLLGGTGETEASTPSYSSIGGGPVGRAGGGMPSISELTDGVSADTPLGQPAPVAGKGAEALAEQSTTQALRPAVSEAPQEVPQTVPPTPIQEDLPEYERVNSRESADELALKISANPKAINAGTAKMIQRANTFKAKAPDLHMSANALRTDDVGYAGIVKEAEALNTRTKSYKTIGRNLIDLESNWKALSKLENIPRGEKTDDIQKALALTKEKLRTNFMALNAAQKVLYNTGAATTAIEIAKFFGFTPKGATEGETDYMGVYEAALNKGILNYNLPSQMSAFKSRLADDFLGEFSENEGNFISPYSRHYDKNVDGFIRNDRKGRAMEVLLSGTGLKPKGKAPTTKEEAQASVPWRRYFAALAGVE